MRSTTDLLREWESYYSDRVIIANPDKATAGGFGELLRETREVLVESYPVEEE